MNWITTVVRENQHDQLWNELSFLVKSDKRKNRVLKILNEVAETLNPSSPMRSLRDILYLKFLHTACERILEEIKSPSQIK